jgi:hypothetical protein
MAQDKFYKYYTDLPGWAKGVVIIGGLGIVYIVGSTIYKKITSVSSIIDAQNKLNVVNKDLNIKKKSGEQPSYTESQYNNFADEIEEANKPAHLNIVPLPTWLGNVAWSNQGIGMREVFRQIKNDTDFLLLQKAYGIRTIKKNFLFGGEYTGSLPQLVNHMLTHYEVGGINDILESNGVTYKF